jgi:hypothetical protein
VIAKGKKNKLNVLEKGSSARNEEFIKNIINCKLNDTLSLFLFTSCSGFSQNKSCEV